uniref:Uncharacterized protein n=1 Tax=Gracilariopsis longissima TaxID=172976 RepID=A0A345U9H2_9FLOR|nr:hypothetical protein [Gracilariopsis longissima]AXI97108.1 hypothetical protein [Gracilariopsis longissima]UAD89024.1 hypothetical protein [Gracilariopsis longissima]
MNIDSLNYIENLNKDTNEDELLLETPIGWSSTCFDETIHYYIDCNSHIDSHINQDQENISNK